MSVIVRGVEMPEADFQPVWIDWVEGKVWNLLRTQVLGELELIEEDDMR